MSHHWAGLSRLNTSSPIPISTNDATNIGRRPTVSPTQPSTYRIAIWNRA